MARRNLDHTQKISLFFFVFFLVALPAIMFLAMNPVKLFSKAYGTPPPPTPTATPGRTPTPTPIRSIIPEPTPSIPRITTTSLPVGYVGRTYSTYVNAEAYNPSGSGLNLDIRFTGLPGGISRQSCALSYSYSTKMNNISCHLSGVPQTSGLYQVTVEVLTYSRTASKKTFTLKIQPKLTTPAPAYEVQ